MGRLVVVATCTLNQWALDFQGNYDRIRASILEAKRQGARLRVGPELEITGYGCQDHFLESDTLMHSWEVLEKLLEDHDLYDIILDIGMPVRHHGVLYNCRIICLDGRILLIRPKLYMADDGNYRESRWFTPWMQPRCTQEAALPAGITRIHGQNTAPFGDAILAAMDATLGIELCEELFVPNAPHIAQSLEGVDIITNSSGSHHELRKLDRRIRLITEATKRCGGVYLYANQRGCDGDRLYYDGSSMIILNGDLLQQGDQFSLRDVQVISAAVDLESVRAFRGLRASRNFAASEAAAYNAPRPYPRVRIEGFHLARMDGSYGVGPDPPREPFLHRAEDEIRLGPACWLWDYLRRSGSSGYFLPLSGGLDSCSTALIVYSMCDIVVKAIEDEVDNVLEDARRVVGMTKDGFPLEKQNDGGEPYVPCDPKELAGRIFHTCYMGTEHSSKETRQRAKELASSIGCYHIDLDMDNVIGSFISLFQRIMGRTPAFSANGGTRVENLALQNIQARSRMVTGYMFAQLLPWIRWGRQGNLLVLGSSNVDEALRGYMTKYDCSSADVNPIGSISKVDLRKFVRYAQGAFGFPILRHFIEATPSAELIPLKEGEKEQSDEEEMGMTYEELSLFGRLRKCECLGPVSMFWKLSHLWTDISKSEVADKVKGFFRYYAINRHKMTTLTPSYHAENYSPEDNRFDLRPFLYPASWVWQFRRIDDMVHDTSESSYQTD